MILGTSILGVPYIVNDQNTSNSYLPSSGNLLLPPVNKVATSYKYGTNGTQYTGTLSGGGGGTTIILGG